MLKVVIDDRDMRRFVATMPKAGKRAQSRALNKAIRQARTVGAREISARRNVKVGRAKGEMRLQMARPGRPQAAVVASGSPIRAIEVKGRKTQTKLGVTAKIGQKGRHLFKGAFIAKMASGHVGIFRRKNKGRLPIIEMTLPSVAATMVNEGVDEIMRSKAAPSYEAELIRLLEWEMRKAGAR